MFDLDDKPRVWIPIYWPGLAPGGGPDDTARVVEHRIDVLVEMIEPEEFRRIFFPGDEDEKTSDYDAFTGVVSDWRKIVIKGVPVPFEERHIKRLIGSTAFVTAFALAYIKAQAGKLETREGNSESSPNAGRAAPKKAKAATKPSSSGTASGSGSIPRGPGRQRRQRTT